MTLIVALSTDRRLPRGWLSILLHKERRLSRKSADKLIKAASLSLTNATNVNVAQLEEPSPPTPHPRPGWGLHSTMNVPLPPPPL